MKFLLALGGAASLALTAGLASAQDVVRLGTEGAYPPYNFTNEAGELVGFEIEFGLELCARAGFECEFVAQDWDGIIPALLNGRYDAIIAGMSITEERKQRVDFSQGYVTTPAVFVAERGGPLMELTGIDETLAYIDDNGLSVGVQAATIHLNFVEQELPNADVRIYETVDLANLDLVAGRIDLAVADLSGFEPFLASEDGQDFALFGPRLTGADFPVFGEGVGMVFRQDDDALREAFDAAIVSMKEDGTLAAMTTEWFGSDISMGIIQ